MLSIPVLPIPLPPTPASHQASWPLHPARGQVARLDCCSMRGYSVGRARAPEKLSMAIARVDGDQGRAGTVAVEREQAKLGVEQPLSIVIAHAGDHGASILLTVIA